MKSYSNKTNFFNLIKNKLFPFYRSKEIQQIFQIINQEAEDKSKTTIMFVGGCVRNFIKGEKVDDIDLATIFLPEEIKKNLKDSKFKVLDTGLDHGSITIVGNEKKYEITTLRKDVITDGRHANVEFSENWQKDSERRDFTMNAIYLSNKGKIFDPQSGLKDLKNNIVKFIGDPEKRIKEDYLRILRFIRFSIKYGHKPEQSTINAIKLNLNGIIKISKERILSELIKIMKSENFLFLVKNLSLKEIFTLIFPEFVHFKRLENFLKFNTQLKLEPKLIISILTVDGSTNHEYFAHKYKISNDLSDYLNKVAKGYYNSLNDSKFFTDNLKKNLYFYGKEIIQNIIIIRELDKTKSRNLEESLKKLKKMEVPNFPITGKLLIKKGLKEGKSLGQAIKLLENYWIENNFQVNKDEISKVVKKFSSS